MRFALGDRVGGADGRRDCVSVWSTETRATSPVASTRRSPTSSSSRRSPNSDWLKLLDCAEDVEANLLTQCGCVAEGAPFPFWPGGGGQNGRFGSATAGVETRAPTAGSHVGQPARRGCGGPAEAGHGVTRRAVATDRRPPPPPAPRRRTSDSNPGDSVGFRPRRSRRRTPRARRPVRSAPDDARAARPASDPGGSAGAELARDGGRVAASPAFLPPRRRRFSETNARRTTPDSTNRDRPSGRGGGGGVADGARVRVRGDRARAGFSPRRARVRRRRRGRESGRGTRAGATNPRGATGRAPGSSFES